MRKLSTLILNILVISLMVGCHNSDVIDAAVRDPSNTTKKDYSIPYASIELLKTFQNNNDVIDFRFSKKAALMEMYGFNAEFATLTSNPQFSLSEFPVVIYDTDGLPKFYEFIVLDGDFVPTATITCFAKKEVTDFTACVLPFIRSYTDYRTLQYTSEYPYVNSNSDKTRSFSEDEAKDISEFTSNEEIVRFWENIKTTETEITKMSNEEFLEKYIRPSLRSTKYYTIPRFDKENLKRTRFSGSGWCGPAAMAWVYRGYYDRYLGKYIPLHGEESTEYYNILKNNEFNVSYYLNTCELLQDIGRLSKTEEGLFTGTLPNDFDFAVNEIFPDYKIQRHKGKIKGAPRKAIQRGNPVYLVVFTANAELHYIIGFGTKDKYSWLGIHSDSWLYVMDNGTNIQHHNYLPYYRNSNFFNLANKYLYMGEFIPK